MKEKQSTLLERKVEERAFRKHAADLEQLIKDESCRDLCLERMKMPQFNGDMRDYPRFKSDFQKQVQPTVGGEQEAAYALNTVFEIIRNVDDDLKEIWERLTKK